MTEEKTQSVPEQGSQDCPPQPDDAQQAQMAQAIGALEKTMTEATKIMMGGLSAFVEGVTETMSTFKFRSYRDLLGSADGEWRCEATGETLRIAEPELTLVGDDGTETVFACTIEVNDTGSTVRGSESFGMYDHLVYQAPRLLDDAEVAPESLSAVFFTADAKQRSIRFVRVKDEETDDNTVRSE